LALKDYFFGFFCEKPLRKMFLFKALCQIAFVMVFLQNKILFFYLKNQKNNFGARIDVFEAKKPNFCEFSVL